MISLQVSQSFRERECYWIEEMLRLGYPLLNVFGNKKAYPQRRAPDNLGEVKDKLLSNSYQAVLLTAILCLKKETIPSR